MRLASLPCWRSRGDQLGGGKISEALLDGALPRAGEGGRKAKVDTAAQRTAEHDPRTRV